MVYLIQSSDGWRRTNRRYIPKGKVVVPMPDEAPPEATTPPSTPLNQSRAPGSGLGTILAAVALVLAIVALALNFVIPGPTGPTGPSFTPATVLQSGQTETGLFAAWGGNGSISYSDTINFRIPLVADLPADNATFIANGSAYTTNCPGPGRALPNQLCIYEVQDSNRLAPGFFDYTPIFNPLYAGHNVSRWGFGVVFLPTASTSHSEGTWSVAGP